MADSTSRNSMLAVGLVVLLVVIVLWWSSGDEESPQVPPSQAPSASRTAPIPTPERQAERMAVEEMADEMIEEESAETRPTRTAQRTDPAELPSDFDEQRFVEDPIFQEVDVESVRARMEQFDQVFPPEVVEALRNPKKPELSPEEAYRLQNAVPPSAAEVEFLLQHGEEAERQEPPEGFGEEQPSALSPSELEMLQNPALEVR